MTKKATTPPDPADEAETDACVTDLETLQGQLESPTTQATPQAGGVSGALPAGVSLDEILAAIKKAAELLKKWRAR